MGLVSYLAGQQSHSRSPEIAHTKLPKWSLWDFIDVGGESKKIEKIFGRNGDNHLNDSIERV